MPGQTFGGRAQDCCHSGIVWHDEGRKELRHVRNAAPFVTGQEPDDQTLFREDLGGRRKRQGDLPALGFVEARQIGGIEIDFPVRDRDPVAAQNTIDRPDLGAQKGRIGGETKFETFEVCRRRIGDRDRPDDRDGILKGGVGETAGNVCFNGDVRNGRLFLDGVNRLLVAHALPPSPSHACNSRLQAKRHFAQAQAACAVATGPLIAGRGRRTDSGASILKRIPAAQRVAAVGQPLSASSSRCCNLPRTNGSGASQRMHRTRNM